tara:strand:- start:137 stop:742 length:606 start_codon:yes stop_codon:yes gene_type:complete
MSFTFESDKLAAAHALRVDASAGVVDGITTVKVDTPVFVMEIGDPFDIAGLISEHRKQDGTNHPSNVKAWRSSYLTHKETTLFNDAVKYLVDKCNEIIAEYYGVFIKHNCIHMWVMEYEKGNYATKHTHYPTDWSAVYYAEMNEKSAPVVIENTLTIHPKSGTLVLFPGTLEHKVIPTSSSRKVLAMNLLKDHEQILFYEY